MQVMNGIPATQLPMARWRKSRASNPSGCCVEVAALPDGAIAMRNSRDPAGPALVYTRAEVAAFLAGVKNGEFDDLYPGGSVVLSPGAAAAASGLRRPASADVGRGIGRRRHGNPGILSAACGPQGGWLIWPCANAFVVDTMGVPGGEEIGADAPGPGAGMSMVSPGDGPPVGRDDEPPGPTALRIIVGSQLRRLREAAGVSPDQAGYEIRATRSKISRMENGRVGFKDRDIADLLTLYGVTDEQVRTRMLSLARQANSTGWWSKYDDVLPDWFEGYVGLEGAVSVIRSFELQFVHGLFQTEGYARAVTLLGHKSAPAEEIDRRVSMRLKRQDVLANPEPPQVWSVMDEAVLRRPLGGRAVMRAQLSTWPRSPVCRTSSFRWCRSAAAATPPRAARSAFCASPNRIFRTSCTSSSSPAPCTSATARTSTTTSRS